MKSNSSPESPRSKLPLRVFKFESEISLLISLLFPRNGKASVDAVAAADDVSRSGKPSISRRSTSSAAMAGAESPSHSGVLKALAYFLWRIWMSGDPSGVKLVSLSNEFSSGSQNPRVLSCFGAVVVVGETSFSTSSGVDGAEYSGDAADSPKSTGANSVKESMETLSSFPRLLSSSYSGSDEASRFRFPVAGG